MKFSVAELDRRIAAGVPHLVCLVGSEEFLRREALATLLESVHGGPPPPEDCVRLDPAGIVGGAELTRIFDELRVPSLFGGRRSLVLGQAEAFLAADPEAWIEFIARPWREGTLFLVADALDGRTRIAKALAQTGWYIEVARLYHRPPPWKTDASPWDNDLNRWLVARARRAGMKLDPKVAHLVQTRAGTRVADLAAALDRLRTLVAAGGTVTRDLVERHTPSGEESTTFELVDALFGGDRRRTLALARGVLERGSVDSSGQRTTDPATLLLGFIGAALARLRQLRGVHGIVAAGGGDAEILSAAGIARAFLPRLREQARASPPAYLDRLVHELYRADADLKKGRGPRADELLERLALLGPVTSPGSRA